MDQHYLTPLFSPQSIVVFAGDSDQPDSQTALARALLTGLRDGGFAGTVTHLDIHMTGTLADLAHSRADLALIALPDDQVAAALEVTGRIRCRAALVLSSGLPTAPCAELLAIAKRHGVHLLGPNSLASSGRCSSSMPARWGRWPRPGRWR